MFWPPTPISWRLKFPSRRVIFLMVRMPPSSGSRDLSDCRSTSWTQNPTISPTTLTRPRLTSSSSETKILSSHHPQETELLVFESRILNLLMILVFSKEAPWNTLHQSSKMRNAFGWRSQTKSFNLLWNLLLVARCSTSWLVVHTPKRGREIKTRRESSDYSAMGPTRPPSHFMM